MKTIKLLIAGMLVCLTCFQPVKAAGSIVVNVDATAQPNQTSLKVTGLSDVNSFSLNLKVEGTGKVASLQPSTALIEHGGRLNYKYNVDTKTLDIYVTSKSALPSDEFELAIINYEGDAGSTVKLSSNTTKDEMKLTSGAKASTVKEGSGLSVISDEITIQVSDQVEGEEDKPEDKDEDVIITNSEFGITITAKKGVIPATATASITKEQNQSILDSIAKQLSQISTKFTVYDISLLDGGNKIQPNGVVTIQIPLPSGYNDDKIDIYHMSDDTKEIMSGVKIESGKITFDTSHFSYYVVAEKNVTAENVDNTIKKPGVSTGDATMAGLLIVMLAAGVGALCYSGYKLKKK